MRILSRALLLSSILADIHCSAASAGTVKIEQSADRSVTVIAEGATISEVVGKLGETYGFRLDHKGYKPADAARDEQLSVDGRYQGSLRTVLDRLLAKESHFVELASQSKSGIARVVLYNVVASSTATGQTATRVVPANPRLPPEPMKAAAAVERTPQAAPPSGPGIVAPIRRVQPAQPPAAPVVRPNAGAPAPVPAKAQATPGQTVVSGAAATPVAQGPVAPQLRRRGGIIQ
jgi:hypothetical protein